MSGSALPPAPGPANCPEVGPSAKVLAGIKANPTSSVAPAVVASNAAPIMVVRVREAFRHRECGFIASNSFRWLIGRHAEDFARRWAAVSTLYAVVNSNDCSLRESDVNVSQK